VWRAALLGVGHALVSHGAAIMGVMTSPLRGADGNVEFLVWARAATPSTGFDIDAMVDGGLAEVDAR
jgi:23S rRNA (cytidine1920-2'-O)/16S rRNA (cytidine1409-2'-O)-methyltransferase